MSVRYPEITVQLVGNDGNAFAIMGATKRALRRGGVDQSVIDEYLKQAMSGDYDHLLTTTMEWVEVQ